MPWAQYSTYFTEKFWKDHVYEGNESQAKRDAEEIYQRRNVSISSVLELDPHAIRILVGEVTRRQPEYAANPHDTFTSAQSSAYWERRLKRAKRMGPAQFQYGVKLEDGVYKLHHFAGVV